ARSRLTAGPWRSGDRDLHRRRTRGQLSDHQRVDAKSSESFDAAGIPLPNRDLSGMRCGLFGKLPAKRDFIALFAPRGFLDSWEPWMQGSISASRQVLSEQWQQAFLTAPIWRFWLGAEICGRTVLGALMSSLDGLGRYYPLTVFGYADPGAAIPPPDLDPQEEWFAPAEEFLLRTLEKDIAFEAVTGALDRLAAPRQETSGSWPDALTGVAEGVVAARVEGHSFL